MAAPYEQLEADFGRRSKVQEQRISIASLGASWRVSAFILRRVLEDAARAYAK
jgi:hypothetical protein